MCGRYFLSSSVDAMAELFGFQDRPNFPPNYNIAPTQPVPVVRGGAAGRPNTLHVMQWSFIANWLKTPPEKPLINARSETIVEKPSFRTAIIRRRCLLPADGYYEWRRAGGQRIPFAISPTVGGLVGLAAIWERWQGADGSDIDTVAIITTQANQALRDIHHRMPVVIQPENYDTWLSPPRCDDTRVDMNAVRLMQPAAEDFFRAHQVSPAVGAVRNNGPELLEEVVPAPEEPDAQFSLF
ncbi:MAG: SOS response-associated peptidase [Alphaproteobacteria bacterium]